METLKEQKGTKDTNWSYMVKKLRTTPGYKTDDGKNGNKLDGINIIILIILTIHGKNSVQIN